MQRKGTNMEDPIEYNNYDYDRHFEKIYFPLIDNSEYWPYKTHPEYLPYVGDKYNQQSYKTLFVLESHYLEDKDSENIYNSNEMKGKSDKEINRIFSNYWYDKNEWSLKKQFFKLKTETNFETRYVANCAIKAIKFNNRVLLEPIFQYKAFQNILNEGYTSDANRKKLRDFAYMNFFQRPSLKKGKQIIWEDIDIEIASKNLIEVINIIKPQLVIFISANSYDLFQEYIKNQNVETTSLNIQIYRFRQPGTRYWSSKTKSEILNNSKCDRDRLKDIFLSLG